MICTIAVRLILISSVWNIDGTEQKGHIDGTEHLDLHSLPTGLGSRCPCLTNWASFYRQLQTFLCCNLSKMFSPNHRRNSGCICLSQSIAASQHPFEVLLATPERCEVETPTFARVVIALELEAYGHASHTFERNVFWSALNVYVGDDHKTIQNTTPPC